MSHRKFAPITSSLLVRKGDAAPSPLPATPAPVTWLADVQKKKAAAENPEPRYVYQPAAKDAVPAAPPCAEGRTEPERSKRIVLNLIGIVFFRVPLALYLSHTDIKVPFIDYTIVGAGLGVVGAWYAAIIDIVVRCVLLMLRFHHDAWQTIDV